MDLSAVTNSYSLAWLRPENKTFARPLNSSAASQERYEQQMKALADARAVLQQLPDKKTSDRRDKSEKVKMLKDRLNMLKQMIPFMSPSAAKSLKAEMKQIASQMASLATGNAGGADSLSASVPDTADATQAGTTVESDTAEASEAVASAAAAPADTPSEDEETTEEAKTDTTDKGAIDKTNAENEEERLFKESLEELKRLFKLIHTMVQRKIQQEGDKGEPLPDIPSQLQVYAVLPERDNSITLQI